LGVYFFMPKKKPKKEETTREEHLRVESEKAVKMLRKAIADRNSAQKRVIKWRNRCAYLATNGAVWKRAWFKLFVPPGYGE